MFNEKYSHGKKFDFDSTNLEYIDLKEYVEQGKTNPFKVMAMFTYEAQYGTRPVIVSEQYNIVCPNHIVKDVTSIMNNAEEVAAVNSGKCGFKAETYKDKNGVTRYSGQFCDI